MSCKSDSIVFGAATILLSLTIYDDKKILFILPIMGAEAPVTKVNIIVFAHPRTSIVGKPPLWATPHRAFTGVKAKGDGYPVLLAKSNWAESTNLLVVLTSISLPFLAKADGRDTPDYRLKADPIIITLNPILFIRANVTIPSLLNLMKVVYWVLAELIVIFYICKIT